MASSLLYSTVDHADLPIVLGALRLDTFAGLAVREEAGMRGTLVCAAGRVSIA